MTAMFAWAPEWLDVGVFRIVELAEPFDGEVLDLVDHLAAAVIALARIAFRVFVGADGADGFHHLVADIVFRGDQFQAGGLAFPLPLDQIENLEILFHKLLYSD